MDEFNSPPAPVQAGATSPARTAALARIGLLGIGAAALIAAAALAFGYGATPTGTLAAGTGTETSGGALSLNRFGGGPGGHGGFGHGGITIAAIDGSSISLETADGWTRTITVDAETTYAKGGDTISLADLAVGDQIAFRQTLEDDGSWTIDGVAVILPHVGGEVTAISGSTITVEQRDGTSATITVNGDTEYQVNGDNAELADVEVGMFLVAAGTENADGSLTATDVRAGERGPGGRGGFHGRPGPNGIWGEKPDTEAPSATDSAN
ncbi:MAG TPA: DUF5666 domain-containing protein [Candidatus Limnocylindria bacterium]|nr:DUF5666 domain-containing protein [Candidatus Limnocylindria bacterium]